VLLDQRVLAGVGNVAKSEALWRCRVDPFAPVSSLDDDRLVALADEAADVLRRGVDDGGRLPRQVYKRGGRPCPRCGGAIRRDVQGEALRSTYWCPACAV
jgi:endonuclease-8